MPFITIGEILDILIMILAVGFIFKDYFRKPEHMISSISDLKKVASENYKFAILVTAPAILFHELGHKFAAMAFGYSATFHAAYFWLGVGVILSVLKTGFIFFVPAFVSHSVVAYPWQSSLIAFAGPAVNLLFWLSTLVYLKTANKRKLEMNTLAALTITKKINMFLFIFNMIPIGVFDGAKVLNGLILTFS